MDVKEIARRVRESQEKAKKEEEAAETIEEITEEPEIETEEIEKPKEIIVPEIMEPKEPIEEIEMDPRTILEATLKEAEDPALCAKNRLVCTKGNEEAKKALEKLFLPLKIKKIILTGVSDFDPKERDRRIMIECRKIDYSIRTLISIFFNEHLKCSQRFQELPKEVFFKEFQECEIIWKEIQSSKVRTIQQEAIQEIKYGSGNADKRMEKQQDYIADDLFSEKDAPANCTGLYDPNYQSYWVFDRKEKELVETAEKDFDFYLRNRFGIAKIQDCKEIIKAVEKHIKYHGIRVTPHISTYFDKKNFIHYRSDNDQGVWRCDGKNIDFVDNGTDGVFFRSKMGDAKFKVNLDDVDIPNYFKGGLDWNAFVTSSSLLKKYLLDLTSFDDEESKLTIEQYKQLFLIYFYSLGYESIQLGKVLPIYLGVQASGKSWLMSAIGKIHFGDEFRSKTMPTDSRDLAAIIANSYYVGFDNVDSKMPRKIQDMLCSITTGVKIAMRILHTTKEEIEVLPHCFIAIGSRTGEFKREDIIDRSIVFKTKKIRNVIAEDDLNAGIEKNRAAIMAEIIINDNEIVALIKQAEKEGRKFVSRVRIASFSKFGSIVWEERKVKSLLMLQEAEKQKFTLEGNIFFDNLSKYIIEERKKFIGDKGEGIKAVVIHSDIYESIYRLNEEEARRFIREFPDAYSITLYLRNNYDAINSHMRLRKYKPTEKHNVTWIITSLDDSEPKEDLEEVPF